jgi:hypothetical protein
MICAGIVLKGPKQTRSACGWSGVGNKHAHAPSILLSYPASKKTTAGDAAFRLACCMLSACQARRYVNVLLHCMLRHVVADMSPGHTALDLQEQQQQTTANNNSQKERSYQLLT